MVLSKDTKVKTRPINVRIPQYTFELLSFENLIVESKKQKAAHSSLSKTFLLYAANVLVMSFTTRSSGDKKYMATEFCLQIHWIIPSDGEIALGNVTFMV